MRLTALLPDIRIMCPGLPEPWQYRVLTRSLQAFLSETQVWQEWTEYAYDFTAAAGGVYRVLNSKYNPTGPVDSVPCVRTDRVLRVKWLPTGENLPKSTLNQLEDCEPDWMTQRSKQPRLWVPIQSGYHSGGGYAVRVYPHPADAADNTVGALKFFVSHTVTEADTPDQVYELETTLTTSGIADWMFRRYREAIVNGAVARALAMPGTDWYNPQVAATLAAAASLGTIKAQSETQAGQTTSTVTVDYGGY